MNPTKFSLKPGSISRFFILLVVVLLVTMGVMIQSAINTWLKDKSLQVMDVAQAIHKRIDTWRYVTWQIYDNVAAASTGANDEIQETRLRQDVYYLEKPRRKTEALIFGSHDSATLGMTLRISNYLDVLWGAESLPWSMYYLNGQDNSMVLISTLPLKDLTSGFKETSISSMVDQRRAEMLQQANALDERESFSSLRQMEWQNNRYITLRTTFNQPGHLATVVAFDLPVNDLLPANLPADNFRFDEDERAAPTTPGANTSALHVAIGFHDGHIEIAVPIPTTSMKLVWEVPTGTLIMETLQNILLALLLNVGLIALALFGFTTFRQQQPGRITPDTPVSNGKELQAFKALNEEILSVLPLGILVHDIEHNRTVISNKTAEHLLPHLNLKNIITMADQHQGVIQATVNNELYEIRQYRSQIASRVQIFVIRDQDKEILVSKKLKQAQRLYEKNQQGRSSFMQHICQALRAPIDALAEKAAAMKTAEHQALAGEADRLAHLLDEMQLLNMLEEDTWKSTQARFSIQGLIDEIVPNVLPVVKRKGLQLLVNNHLPVTETRHGDRAALQRMLMMLLNYSATTTEIGKITLDIDQDESQTDGLLIRILDTGKGISSDEVDNLNFPFLNATSEDRYNQANGLTFYLCNQLARKMGGNLTIRSKDELGTCYTLQLRMAHDGKPAQEKTEPDEGLLDDVVAMVDVASNEVRRMVTRQLENWGATCISPDERSPSQAFDIFLTDNPSNLTASGLLLSDDEPGLRKTGPARYRVNFNMSNALQDAVLQLIEAQLADESVVTSPGAGGENAQLHASGYYALFVDTVPEDVKRLQTESKANDLLALAQTAHRLKGVFAMLNLTPGKQLCETLEHHIREKDAPAIEKNISDIDTYVNSLL